MHLKFWVGGVQLGAKSIEGTRRGFEVRQQLGIGLARGGEILIEACGFLGEFLLARFSAAVMACVMLARPAASTSPIRRAFIRSESCRADSTLPS